MLNYKIIQINFVQILIYNVYKKQVFINIQNILILVGTLSTDNITEIFLGFIIYMTLLLMNTEYEQYFVYTMLSQYNIKNAYFCLTKYTCQ